MIIDSHENLHLALCLTHGFFFLNFSNTHKMLFNSDSLQHRVLTWENEKYPYIWPVKLTFDKTEAVADFGCLYSNETTIQQAREASDFRNFCYSQLVASKI